MHHRLRKILRENYFLFILLVLFFCIWLILYPHFYQLFWDGAVYISNAKHLFSLGEIAYWESVRPILFPLVLGLFWKLGANLLHAGKILELLFSLGIISLAYLISKRLLGRKVASIAATIVAFNPLFLFWTFKLYTSIPGTFFFLAALYLMLYKRYLWSGLLAIMAVMTRYPLVVLLLCLELYLLRQYLQKPKKKQDPAPLIYFNLPVTAGIAIFLVFSHFKHDFFLDPVIELVRSTGWQSQPLFFANNAWIYLKSFLAFFHLVLLFLVAGICLFIQKKKIISKRDETFFLILLPPLLLFVFFQAIGMKDERYIIPLIPFIAIISASALSKVRRQVAELAIVGYAIFSLGILMAFPAPHFTFFPEAAQDPLILQRCPLDAKVASSNPISVHYWDDTFSFISDRAKSIEEFAGAEPHIQCIFYNSCDFTGEFPEEMMLEEYELIYEDESYCQNRVYARR